MEVNILVFKKKDKVLETENDNPEFIYCKVNRKCNDIIHNDKIINVTDGMVYVTKGTYEELKDIGLVE